MKRERERETERPIDVREKHCSVATRTCPDWYLIHNLRYVLWRDWTRSLMVYRTTFPPTEPPGLDSYIGIFKSSSNALIGATEWVGHCPGKGKVEGSNPSQGTCLGCRPGPQWGCVRGILPLFYPPFPSSLKKKINKIFLKRKSSSEDAKVQSVLRINVLGLRSTV